jgi:hypothetical protein
MNCEDDISFLFCQLFGDTSRNQPERLDSDNQINVSRLIVYRDTMHDDDDTVSLSQVRSPSTFYEAGIHRSHALLSPAAADEICRPSLRQYLCNVAGKAGQ